MKDQDKIVWFDSGQNHFYDQAFYCKPCWRKYFLMQPLEKRKEWKVISNKNIGEKDEKERKGKSVSFNESKCF